MTVVEAEADRFGSAVVGLPSLAGLAGFGVVQPLAVVGLSPDQFAESRFWLSGQPRGGSTTFRNMQSTSLLQPESTVAS